MFLSQLTLFDYFIAVVVLFSIILGLWRGFTRELIALMAWALAVLCGILFSPWLASYLHPLIKSLLLAHVLSFFMILAVVLLLGLFVSAVISRVAASVTIGFVDRPLGALFGLARGVLISALIVLLIGHTALQKSDWFEKSFSTHYLEKVNHAVAVEYDGVLKE